MIDFNGCLIIESSSCFQLICLKLLFSCATMAVKFILISKIKLATSVSLFSFINLGSYINDMKFYRLLKLELSFQLNHAAIWLHYLGLRVKLRQLFPKNNLNFIYADVHVHVRLPMLIKFSVRRRTRSLFLTCGF